MAYVYGKRTDMDFDVALARTRACLSANGFGIISEIDVQAKFKERLGIDIGSYVILGACNPSLAYAALSAEPDIGVFLPCNVILREDGGGTVVSTALPTVMMDVVGNADVAGVASEAEASLKKAVDAIG